MPKRWKRSSERFGKRTVTPERLIQFEQRVAEAFEAGRIRAPVHLASPGQAEPLIEFFKDFRPGVDWLCSNWRSHYHCLLAGWPEDELFQAILDGRSMYLCAAKYRTICSAIVGGVLPIACGLALGAKMKRADERVFVCIGDMTAETGAYHEFHRYCCGHELPVRVIVEDNGLSTDSPTLKTWGTTGRWLNSRLYRYQRTTAHCGIGRHVSF